MYFPFVLVSDLCILFSLITKEYTYKLFILPKISQIFFEISQFTKTVQDIIYIDYEAI